MTLYGQTLYPTHAFCIQVESYKINNTPELNIEGQKNMHVCVYHFLYNIDRTQILIGQFWQ